MSKANTAILVKVVIFTVLGALVIGCGPSAPPPGPRVKIVTLGAVNYYLPDMKAWYSTTFSGSVGGRMEKARFDEALLSLAADKAKQLRTNPIPLATNRTDTIMVVGNGTSFCAMMRMTAVDFRITLGMVPVSLDEKMEYGLVFREGDMICNVGDPPIKLGDITLHKGEYAIYRQGLKKQVGSLGGPAKKLAAAAEPKPDDAVVAAGRKRAKELGCNPIPVYTNQKGEIIICKGALFTIRNNRWAATENDMIINAGAKPVKVGKYSLAKGEAAVVKNGKFEKLPDKLGIGEKTTGSIPKRR